jgi:heme-degrading monooxygenase HmoA
MIARVLRVTVAADEMDRIVEVYRREVRPIHARAAGLRHHHVLVNRDQGSIEIVGIWDDAASIAAIAAELEPARARLWAQFGQQPALEMYEVADTLPDE